MDDRVIYTGDAAKKSKLEEPAWRIGAGCAISILFLVAFLVVLWLLPKILKGTSDVHLGRNAAVLSRNKENHIFNILQPLCRFDHAFQLMMQSDASRVEHHKLVF